MFKRLFLTDFLTEVHKKAVNTGDITLGGTTMVVAKRENF